MTKLDKIFEKKLKHYQASPSEKAWNKLETKLDQRRKNSTYFWIRLAAALLLPALLIGYLWISTDKLSPKDRTIAINNNEVESPSSSDQTSAIKQPVQKDHEKSQSATADIIPEFKPEATSQEKVEAATAQPMVQQHQEKASDKPDISLPADHAEMLMAQVDIALPDVEIKPTSLPEKKKVIVTYISGGRTAKNSSPGNEMNNDSTQNQAFLAKVVEFAREDVALEKFVEAKDNILAFNFLKSKGQNSK